MPRLVEYGGAWKGFGLRAGLLHASHDMDA